MLNEFITLDACRCCPSRYFMIFSFFKTIVFVIDHEVYFLIKYPLSPIEIVDKQTKDKMQNAWYRYINKSIIITRACIWSRPTLPIKKCSRWGFHRPVIPSISHRINRIHPFRPNKIDYPVLLPCRRIRLDTLQGLIRLPLGCPQRIRSREEWFCCVDRMRPLWDFAG